MRSNSQRRDDIRDEMLIDMARGIQFLIASSTGFNPSVSPMTITGRIDGHIDMLKREMQS